MKQISFVNLIQLKKHSGGLTLKEVIDQKKRFGENSILEVASNRWIELLKETIKDPMIWFLLGIGLVFVLIGQHSEALTLFVAILPLILMDAFLHWRTQAATLGLKSNLSSKITVIREHNEVTIDSKELVPGDLLKISTGLFIPADGILEEAHEVQIDESVLTGEAFPISKIKSGIDPFNHLNTEEITVQTATLAFAGTRVLTGSGLLRILYTGTNTSYGEIIQSVTQMPTERTPLQIATANLVKNLIYIATIFCILLAGVRVYQGNGWLDALISSATLAIAAIPEEFPLVFSFFLGVGIYRLAQHKALVRRAVSVENIGRVTQICTDKTGTITTGELKLAHTDLVKSTSYENLVSLSALASNPEAGDPVDMAILKESNTLKLENYTVLKRFPFTEDRKKESVIVEHLRAQKIITKGSPETIFKLTTLSEDEKLFWLNKTSNWAREGHKILACAEKYLKVFESSLPVEHDSGFSFIGLLIFEDPARPEVSKAVKYAYDNNIKVLMITGDHPETATAIARDIGLGVKNIVSISCAENESFKFEETYLNLHPEFLRSLDVVARCTPMQKLRIVQALKKSGEIVAVTGDGVNDVPALKAADIGIAMGLRGSRSAKEVSSIILGDDNFRTIVVAIMEGRQLFKNLKISFQYLLLIHIPFVLTAALIPLLGYPLLYLPVHIVWLELIIHPTAILAFQAISDSNSKISSGQFFEKTDIYQILFIGLVLTTIITFSFTSSLDQHLSVELARAKVMGILTFWSAAIVIYYTRLKTKTSALIATFTFLSTVFLIQAKSFSTILKSGQLSIYEWFNIVLIIVILTVLNWLFDFNITRKKIKNI
jgi:Ca2+-transporting ATPase